MDKPLISVENLHKTFELKQKIIPVLRGLNLELAAGDMISIMGASGAGKTTLLQILGTLDEPTSGRLNFGGIDPFSLSDRSRAQFRRHNVGFVFQFHHLLPQFTALENVMMPARIDRMPIDKARALAARLLERMGLSDRMDHRPGELSGGEQQRVAVARALVMEPKVVLADEPTGNLDVATGEEIHDLLFELNEEIGSAMIIVTHNPSLARRMPRRFRLTAGKLERIVEGPAS